MRLDSAAVLRTLRMPRSVLVPTGAPMRNMRLWDKCTEEVKRAPDEIEDQSRRQDVRTRLLREWWSKHEVLLVCLVDKASGSLGLLAVRKEPVSVRFYVGVRRSRSRPRSC